ncbi:hypothetical protein ACFVU4_23865 [Streptomyces sp. NPDC058107]|uniref:hypothetical protein n=1 Tax=Streptomyces sp. NPDC058107 TaxID=3346343 RepID=UPI0036F139A1
MNTGGRCPSLDTSHILLYRSTTTSRQVEPFEGRVDVQQAQLGVEDAHPCRGPVDQRRQGREVERGGRLSAYASACTSTSWIGARAARPARLFMVGRHASPRIRTNPRIGARPITGWITASLLAAASPSPV